MICINLTIIIIWELLLSMTRKLLIVGGDSWSNPNEDCYVRYGVKKIWADVVADFPASDPKKLLLDPVVIAVPA